MRSCWIGIAPDLLALTWRFLCAHRLSSPAARALSHNLHHLMSLRGSSPRPQGFVLMQHFRTQGASRPPRLSMWVAWCHPQWHIRHCRCRGRGRRHHV